MVHEAMGAKLYDDLVIDISGRFIKRESRLGNLRYRLKPIDTSTEHGIIVCELVKMWMGADFFKHPHRGLSISPALKNLGNLEFLGRDSNFRLSEPLFSKCMKIPALRFLQSCCC